MTTEHLPLLQVLDRDPEVMRYLLGRARTSEEITTYWGPRCADQDADARGLGFWAGFAGERFIGWWDLDLADWRDREVTPETIAEAGWRLRRDAWGEGLATEGAMAVLDYGFDALGLDQVWAETMAVNAASRGVMRKLGMRHVHSGHRLTDRSLPGVEEGEVVYAVTAEQWRLQRARG